MHARRQMEDTLTNTVLSNFIKRVKCTDECVDMIYLLRKNS